MDTINQKEGEKNGKREGRRRRKRRGARLLSLATRENPLMLVARFSANGPSWDNPKRTNNEVYILKGQMKEKRKKNNN